MLLNVHNMQNADYCLAGVSGASRRGCHTAGEMTWLLTGAGFTLLHWPKQEARALRKESTTFLWRSSEQGQQRRAWAVEYPPEPTFAVLASKRSDRALWKSGHSDGPMAAGES